MSKFSEDQEKFFKTFNAGEYSLMTVMVKNKDIEALIDHLKAAGVDLVVLPGVSVSSASKNDLQ